MDYTNYTLKLIVPYSYIIFKDIILLYNNMKIENKNDLLLKSLLIFYKKNTNMKILYNYVSKSASISLRIFDFLCTKYIKNKSVIYYIEKNNKRIPFNLSVAYKAQLKAYSKLQFDPFKRHDRIDILCNLSPTGKLTTTVGQLNFFKFAIDNKLIDWIEVKENLTKIEAAISSDTKSNKLTKEKTKRMTTSTNNFKITVTFK